MATDILPIQVGAVFYEDDSGEDQGDDIFEITFLGGVEGTQLKEILIDTDKHADGLTEGDPFFDIADDGPGVFNAYPFTILDASGIKHVDVAVKDGGTLLRITFDGFDPGEKLTFSIDVDEKGFRNASAVTEGEEFEGAKLSATFTAAHFFDASGTDIFLDYFDANLAKSGLALPSDSYVPPGTKDHPVRTAGAIFPVGTQQPLPSTLAGTVFEDLDADNVRDPGELGLEQVIVSLLPRDVAGNPSTARTVHTDQNGEYQFQGVLPGVYRIVQTQPDGFLSVGASAGTVNGKTRGIVADVDTIGEITLFGGEESIDNDFAEARPVSISGFVYHDVENNGQRASDEPGIQDVTLYITNDTPDGAIEFSTSTLDDGSWSVDRLMPGVYRVVEMQPEGYLDGLDTAGTTNGTVNGMPHNPGDSINGIVLRSGQSGVEYNFGERMPGSILGRVYVDRNGNETLDSAEPLLQGVSIHLLDTNGMRLDTTQTDPKGEYAFTGLAPGVYGVEEIQPDDYHDGIDHVGSEGGSLQPPDSIVDIILGPSVKATGYDFSEQESASLAGSVYEDANLDHARSKKETGIANVELILLDSKGNPTGHTTRTDANGFYRFEGLSPGVYGIAETQPFEYLDGADTPGTAGGTAMNPGDRISGATLETGMEATGYDFTEYRATSITGRVLVDDGDGPIDPEENPVENVTIHLLDSTNQRIATTTTDKNGRYTFDHLEPGVYGIEEIQPDDYFDGDDHPGSIGGTPVDPDTITKIKLLPGTHAEDYFFTELRPGSLSGYVFQDGPPIELMIGESLPPNVGDLRDGQWTDDDTPLSGVELILADANGVPLLDASGNFRSTVTDETGYYEFTRLKPNIDYSVLEQHPEGYVDGIDTPGSNGGMALNVTDTGYVMTLGTLQLDVLYQTDAITRIQVGPGEEVTWNNFSEVKTTSALPWIPPPTVPTSEPLVEPAQAFGESASPYFVYVPTPTQIMRTPGFGAGSVPINHTWHLSVINAGQPRRSSEPVEHVARIHNAYFNPDVWSQNDMNRAQWTSVDSNGKPIMEAVYGLEGGTPLAGDFNGDGVAEMAIFFDGLWFIDLNGNGIWDQGDLWMKMGQSGDLPVVGDWDGDGKDDVGIYGPAWIGDARAILAEPGLPDVANNTSGRPKNVPPDPEDATVGRRTMKRTAQGAVRSDVIDHVFKYGTSQDIAIAGDFNGDGVSNIGLFREGSWYLDIDGNGRWSRDDVYIESLGDPHNLPVVGDFNGDGIDDLGVFNHGRWHLDTNGDRILDARDRIFELGTVGDKPVVADFDGDGIDDPAVYREGQPSSSHREASRHDPASTQQR